LRGDEGEWHVGFLDIEKPSAARGVAFKTNYVNFFQFRSCHSLFPSSTVWSSKVLLSSQLYRLVFESIAFFPALPFGLRKHCFLPGSTVWSSKALLSSQLYRLVFESIAFSSL
jgi:hypothetical protein